VGETSGFGIVKAKCGAAWLKVRVKGREVYTPRLERGSSIKDNPNAFAKAAHVILALEEWAIQYQQKEKFEFAGGTIVPKAQVMNVRGAGGVSQASPTCDIYLDVRLVPGKKPEAVKKMSSGSSVVWAWTASFPFFNIRGATSPRTRNR